MAAISSLSCPTGWLLAAVATAVALKQYVVLVRQVRDLHALLSKEEKERAAERAGRIRAQKELRERLMPGGDAGSATSYPFTPIGTIRSCFSTRNGTPRQPLLVSMSRARLTLTPGGVPAMALDGLAQYSHCWVLYVFHENTDIGRLWTGPNHENFRAKVKVPRLNGGRLGVLATRSPHRPCPIGLSIAKIEKVDGPNLYLSGVDIVDGSPVLDVKPYLAYCDSLPDASAPDWVEASGPADPLLLKSVSFGPNVEAEVDKCWEKMGKQSLYGSPRELLNFAVQVLSRDIRSVHQRQATHESKQKLPNEPTNEAGRTGDKDASDSAAERVDSIEEETAARGSLVSVRTQRGDKELRSDTCTERDITENLNTEDGSIVYHLIVEGLDFRYTVSWEGHVTIAGADLRT